MENRISKSRGLTGFQIKIIALILMFLDHIGYIFEYTNSIPLWFNQAGRLSASLFVFIFVEGFVHTNNRKKFFFRIYSIYFIMGLIRVVLLSINPLRPDGFIPANQIFANFVILFILFTGIEYLKNKKYIKGGLLLLIPWFYSMIIFTFMGILGPKEDLAFKFQLVFFPVFGLIQDGGIPFIIEGLLLYIFRKKRKLQAFVFVIFVLTWFVILLSKMVPDFNIHTMFNKYYEWLSIFSVFIMIKYNGERGRNMKKLFYYFYPLHIYILYLISIILMNFY